MVSHATNNRLEVQLHNRAEGGAIFITPSDPGSRDSPAMAVEQMIEAHFLGEPRYLTNIKVGKGWKGSEIEET